MKTFFNYVGNILFNNSLSLADVVAITTLVTFGGWWLLGLIPWIFISAHCALKFR